MDNPELGSIILAALLGAIVLIVIIAVIFGNRLDRKGIKNSKKIDAGNDGSDSVYLS